MIKNIEHAIMHFVLGDIIGYGNGKIEFNNGKIYDLYNFPEYKQVGAEQSNALVFAFLFTGGFSAYPLPNWTISDDTIMMMSNARAIIKWRTEKNIDLNVLFYYIEKEYTLIIDDTKNVDAHETFLKKYGGGLTTTKNLMKLLNGHSYKNFPYDNNAGGSGGSMRSGIFGILFYEEKDVIKLATCAIQTTMMTHPNAIAFLGSLAIALFVSYAIQKQDLIIWPILMIKFINSDKMTTVLKNVEWQHMTSYETDKHIFIEKWQNYYEERFMIDCDTKLTTYKRSKAMMYCSERSLFYHKFSKNNKTMYPGAGGDDSVIIAFDCLMDCRGSVDKIVIYSMLHVGDSDTTGAICGLLYGLVYGDGGLVSKSLKRNINVNQLPEIKEIIKSLKEII